MTANCDICGQPVTTEFTARNGKFLHVSCLFREWCEQAVEIDRLRQFRDRVLSAMTEHAGGAQEYAYIWQSEWDRIKAECGEPNERKDGGK